MAVFFKINSKTIKAPTELTCTTEVLDKSERTMDGTMVVDVIGRKRKVEVAWKYLSKDFVCNNPNENTIRQTSTFL